MFCIGRNYVEHAKELNNKVPAEPIIFMKPQSAYLYHKANFYYPEFTNELHYEGELVLRISKNGKQLSVRNAAGFFDAITMGIDFTARDIQNELKAKGLPWEKAKSWDNSAVVGDWLPFTPDMFKNPIHFSLDKNDERVQTGNSEDMIFPFARLISNISRYFSLNIGDLVFTGTPAGVGECVVGDEFKGRIFDKEVLNMLVK